jgi:hypothetical protein
VAPIDDVKVVVVGAMWADPFDRPYSTRTSRSCSYAAVGRDRCSICKLRNNLALNRVTRLSEITFEAPLPVKFRAVVAAEVAYRAADTFHGDRSSPADAVVASAVADPLDALEVHFQS